MKFAWSLMFVIPSVFAGTISSGGPIQQVVPVSQSMTAADYPGARDECLAGTSEVADQVQMLAKAQAERDCTTGSFDTWQVQYSISERQDGVPSFDCVLSGQAFCHVNVSR